MTPPNPPEQELLACPFCGGEAKLYQDLVYATGEPDPHGWFVRCDPCDLIHDSAWACSSPEEAAKGWNTRRTPTPSLSEAEARELLRDACEGTPITFACGSLSEAAAIRAIIAASRSTDLAKVVEALRNCVNAIGDWSRPTGANGMTSAPADHSLNIAAKAGRQALASIKGEVE